MFGTDTVTADTTLYAKWISSTKLTASDGAANDYFGSWVAVSEDGLTVVVGSPDDDISYSDQGSVWIF